MAKVTVRAEGIELDSPIMVEGFPGVGLVGKIATDHLVDTLDMTYYASVDDCEGLPRLAAYQADDRQIRPPIRVYADEEHDLLALQSDVPVSRSDATDFAVCVTDWLGEVGATPLYLSGFPTDKGADAPSLYGIATGGGERLLSAADIDPPGENGLVSGPTGALLHRAGEVGLPGVGLVVESDPRFPDPEAARVLLQHGIGPIASVDVETDRLVEQAESIREQKEQLAQQMGEASEDESTQAKPLRMYQ